MMPSKSTLLFGCQAFSLLLLVSANPLQKRQSSSGPTQTPSPTFTPGQLTSNVYPPPGVTPGPTSDFPNESQINLPGNPQTGVELGEATITTAYPYKTHAYPMLIPSPYDSNQTASSSDEGVKGGDFNPLNYMGNLSPWRSLNGNESFGLPDASPSIPQGCSLQQLHLIYRHGSRYPTGGAAPQAFQTKLVNSTGWTASGPLTFLNTWSYGLGAEILTPFGRLQEVELGVGYRNKVGFLLDNFTAQSTLPVWTTTSEDRMVRSALNFAAGFFGIPDYTEQVNILIKLEGGGFNDTLAAYDTCNDMFNGDDDQGGAASTNYTNIAFKPAQQRIQQWITGFNVSLADVNGMLQLCAYETINEGYSNFCPLFDEEDFRAFQYGLDLNYYYKHNNGWGAPNGAAQGLGFLQELIERLTHNYNATGATGDSEQNTTLLNPTQSPLNQSIYADATHEIFLLAALTAFNLTATTDADGLPIYTRNDSRLFTSSKIIPMATHLETQVLQCTNYSGDSGTGQYMRFILNDAVIPITNFPGCPQDTNGLCPFNTTLSALQARAAQINYDFGCFGNYTEPVLPASGTNLGGLPVAAQTTGSYNIYANTPSPTPL